MSTGSYGIDQIRKRISSAASQGKSLMECAAHLDKSLISSREFLLHPISQRFNKNLKRVGLLSSELYVRIHCTAVLPTFQHISVLLAVRSAWCECELRLSAATKDTRHYLLRNRIWSSTAKRPWGLVADLCRNGDNPQDLHLKLLAITFRSVHASKETWLVSRCPMFLRVNSLLACLRISLMWGTLRMGSLRICSLELTERRTVALYVVIPVMERIRLTVHVRREILLSLSWIERARGRMRIDVVRYPSGFRR